ncbi:MAG: hypothetical protein JRJ41_03885 [Deltaproteobacteria bacterium]|nr:hypothetical protein [Deltaproteobacteria bacterium]
MDEYLDGNELLRRWNIIDIQLFNRCKKGELQPYNFRLEKIVTLDSFKGTKEFEEFILKRKQDLKRIEEGSEAAGDLYCGSGISPPYTPLTDEELEKEATEDFRPEGCELYDYGLLFVTIQQASLSGVGSREWLRIKNKGGIKWK